jgi:hypothetical protein
MCIDHDTKPSRPTMWCMSCGYPLDGLSEPRCPECGLNYDVRDMSTFSLRPPPGQCPACAKQPEAPFFTRDKVRLVVVCRYCGARLHRLSLTRAWQVALLLLWVAAALFVCALVFLGLISGPIPIAYSSLVFWFVVGGICPFFVVTPIVAAKRCCYSNHQSNDDVHPISPLVQAKVKRRKKPRPIRTEINKARACADAIERASASGMGEDYSHA